MAGAVIFSAIVFTVILVWQFAALEQRTKTPAPPTIAWTAPGREPANFQQQLQLANVQASYDLERETIARRYGETNALLEARLW
ncbi:MAG TPA: hypothetical protein VMT68_10440, partial [Caulobacteraceae bacterium]|nr:hypothetical protein [Caulobacteraceae bacterium]